MSIHSHLSVSKDNSIDSKIPKIWNNLIRAMLVMNGEEPPSQVFSVNNVYLPLNYSSPNFSLGLYNTFSDLNIGFRCSSSAMNDLGSAFDIIAATTSALEYVVGREESLDITSWTVSVGDNDYVYQDVGVDSMAYVLNSTKNCATALFEECVEPKLDEIEEVCL